MVPFECSILVGSAASREDSVPVLDWLVEVASPIVEPIAFHGGNINPGAAIQTEMVGVEDGKV